MEEKTKPLTFKRYKNIVLDTGEFPSKKSEDYLREKSKSRLFIFRI